MKIFLRSRLLRFKEIVWFYSPRFIHKLDYSIAKIRLKYNLYFPMQKTRGARFYKRKLFYVNPMKINFYDAERFFSSYNYIQSGNWDKKKEELENKIQFRIIHELITLNKEINQISCYENLIQSLINRGNTYSQAVKSLDEKYTNIKRIYEDIKLNGYRSQKELKASEENKFNTWYDEMRVSVDRNGEFILSGSGNHRLMMARLLKLNRVPVIIVRIHSDFYYKNQKMFD